MLDMPGAVAPVRGKSDDHLLRPLDGHLACHHLVRFPNPLATGTFGTVGEPGLPPSDQF